MSRTAVLAYSGGLDTSCAIAWLKEDYGFDEVIAVLVDVGQEFDLDASLVRGKAAGADDVLLVDRKDAFADEQVAKAIKANALYEGRYPLVSALSRPVVAEAVGHVVDPFLADAEAIRLVCHPDAMSPDANPLIGPLGGAPFKYFGDWTDRIAAGEAARDFEQAEERLFALRAAARGITDLDKVLFDVWAYGGSLIADKYRGRRIGWTDIWYRDHEDSNPYANPVSGTVSNLNVLTAGSGTGDSLTGLNAVATWSRGNWWVTRGVGSRAPVA